MSINTTNVVVGEQIRLLDKLQQLLEKQIEMIQRGDIGGVEALSKQTNSLVEECVKSGVLSGDGFENQRRKLGKLYERLSLALSAQKAETAKQIKQINKGKKTLKTYRNSI